MTEKCELTDHHGNWKVDSHKRIVKCNACGATFQETFEKLLEEKSNEALAQARKEWEEEYKNNAINAIRKSVQNEHDRHMKQLYETKESFRKAVEELEKELSVEGKRLSKLADKNMEAGDIQESRRAFAACLTIGMNVKRIVEAWKKKWEL